MFKKGDKVKALVDINEYAKKGDILLVDDGFDFYPNGHTGFNCGKGFVNTEWLNETHKSRFEFVKEEKEEMQFDMKKEPWYVLVADEQEYNAACDWAKAKGFDFMYSGDYYKGITAISNHLNSDGTVGRRIYRCDRCDDLSKYHEIKLTFKTIIDSVTFPEVKTEQQKQIEELEKTILLAKQQIETLKKGE